MFNDASGFVHRRREAVGQRQIRGPDVDRIYTGDSEDLIDVGRESAAGLMEGALVV